MTPIELMDRVGGEVLANKIRATVGGKVVVLARMIDTSWQFTDDGQELANLHSNQRVAEDTEKPEAPAAKTARGKKAKDVQPETPATLQELPAFDPAEVELPDLEPDL